MMKKFLVLILCAVTLSGCYWQAEISESEVGLQMSNGISVDTVVYTGRYTDNGWYADLKEIDTSAKTITWNDPDLVTKDKQVIGVDAGVTYRRTRDKEKVKTLWNTYPNEATSDESLAAQVNNRMARSIKEVTSQFSLDEMLGTAGTDVGRDDLTKKAFDLLSKKLDEVGIELLDLGINNISPSASYRASLEAKTSAQVAVEVSQKETVALQEKLKQEQAQTQIALEQAKRENDVAAIKAQVIEQSPEAFEIEKIKAMATMLGSHDKIYFVPQGSDISIFLGQQPVVSQEPVVK